MYVGIEQRRARRGDGVHGEPERAVLESIIVSSYREMPGLCLRLEQAARLFGLRPATCRVVMEDLVKRGSLRRTHNGQYRRTD
jgi:hypothetical protein